MPGVDPAALELFAGLDRFLQWDLVTVNPWGSPAISPVGARLVADEATVWTSTTVGYAAKVRNIEAHPRVALLRVHPDEPTILVRGEARVVAGDGTLNLAQLFRLMGGAGGARRFFATSAKDPFWSRLYRSYWHRYLIAIQIVEISQMGPQGWEPIRVGGWSRPKRTLRTSSPPRRRSARSGGLLDGRGRALLEAGVPAAFASVASDGACPSIWPVRARIDRSGEIRVDTDFQLPPGRLPHSTLAVRVVDDSFEVAQMAGWIGALEAGRRSRRWQTRAAYGFIKPPGVVGDVAAGLAALVQAAKVAGRDQVTAPDMTLALALGGTETAPSLQLPDSAWLLLEQIFSRRNAAAPWYAGMAVLTPDRRTQQQLTAAAERAQLERDWAHGLL
ncbi:MAG: pyridoxamine 5'-phosphate oxidase family protein, partial [Candidatus Dormiibacterota bacterium]